MAAPRSINAGTTLIVLAILFFFARATRCFSEIRRLALSPRSRYRAREFRAFELGGGRVVQLAAIFCRAHIQQLARRRLAP